MTHKGLYSSFLSTTDIWNKKTSSGDCFCSRVSGAPSSFRIDSMSKEFRIRQNERHRVHEPVTVVENRTRVCQCARYKFTSAESFRRQKCSFDHSLSRLTRLSLRKTRPKIANMQGERATGCVRGPNFVWRGTSVHGGPEMGMWASAEVDSSSAGPCASGWYMCSPQELWGAKALSQGPSCRILRVNGTLCVSYLVPPVTAP